MSFCGQIRCFFIGIILLIPLICLGELRQPYNDLDMLLKEANVTQERLIHFLNSIERKSIVIDPGVKGLKTINQLLATRWNGDASLITDFARATIGVENIKDVYDCLDMFKNSSLKIVDIKDNFFNPTPENYRDINIVFRDEVNGMLGEVQINTMSLLNYKENEGHQLFDKIRTLRAEAKIAKRELTAEEQRQIDEATEISKSGYDAAFTDSLNVEGMPIRIGVYAVIIKDDKMLMVHTTSGSKSIINFPGGGVEPGEGFIGVVKRECMEELGMNIEIKKFLYSSKSFYVHDDFPHNYMYNFYFLATVDDEMRIPAELQAEWFSITNPPLEKMLPIDQEFVATIT